MRLLAIRVPASPMLLRAFCRCMSLFMCGKGRLNLLKIGEIQMKRFFGILSLMLVIGYGTALWADSYTLNYRLTKPSRGSANWDTKINTNMDTIDELLLEALDGNIYTTAIRPESFGAIGDGITDAIQAAITAAAPVPASFDYDDQSDHAGVVKLAYQIATKKLTASREVEFEVVEYNEAMFYNPAYGSGLVAI